MINKLIKKSQKSRRLIYFNIKKLNKDTETNIKNTSQSKTKNNNISKNETKEL